MTEMAQALRNPGPIVLLSPHGFPSRRVRWGYCWQVGTPAYWVGLTATAIRDSRLSNSQHRHRLGGNLVEEVAACVLGGHGLPHQVGLAAFEAVRDGGLLRRPVDASDIEQVLRRPLKIGDRTVRYRFPAQRARYLASALARLRKQSPPESARALREWLLEIPGIGPKTAGWIIRNHLTSDDFAVIDTHVLKAGIDASVFDASWTPAQHYDLLEAMFLAWARQGAVSAADLDAVIWGQRARIPKAYTS